MVSQMGHYLDQMSNSVISMVVMKLKMIELELKLESLMEHDLDRMYYLVISTSS